MLRRRRLKPGKRRMSFPRRTPPDQDGKPRFMVAGDEGPRARDNEKRRHVYKRGSVPVHIKIMTRGKKGAFNAYRVTRCRWLTGWQYRKPDGFMSVPYLAGDLDASMPWCFGPRARRTLIPSASAAAAPSRSAASAKGCRPGCEQYFAGKHLVILADNDEKGSDTRRRRPRSRSASRPASACPLPELAIKQDVSDWFARRTLLRRIWKREVQATDEWQPATEQLSEERAASSHEQNKSPLCRLATASPIEA